MWMSDNFVGGHLALDFLNTVGDTDKSRTDNRLTSPDDLLSWLAASGNAGEHVDQAHPTQYDVDALVNFREATYLVLSAYSGTQAVAPEHLQTFEDYTKAALRRAELSLSSAPSPWKATGGTAAYYLDSFVLLVEDLLRSPEIGKLRQCERCSWFFLNAGRGRGRRWCNMSTCGNRHKVAAHRQRRQTNVAGG